MHSNRGQNPTGPSAALIHPHHDSMNELIALSDYRGEVANIYRDVRARLDEGDPADAHHLWQTRRDELWRTHPASPIPGDQRDEWKGLQYWDYNPDFAFTAPFSATAPLEGRDEPEGTVVLSGHKGPWGEVFPAAAMDLPVGTVYAMWMVQYGGGLFLAFKDQTNGDATYGGGRYLLDGPKGAWLGSDNGRLRIDFNFAYHPSCARSPEWNCPLALDPPLDAAIEAGEQLDRPAWS